MYKESCCQSLWLFMRSEWTDCSSPLSQCRWNRVTMTNIVMDELMITRDWLVIWNSIHHKSSSHTYTEQLINRHTQEGACLKHVSETSPRCLKDISETQRRLKHDSHTCCMAFGHHSQFKHTAYLGCTHLQTKHTYIRQSTDTGSVKLTTF